MPSTCARARQVSPPDTAEGSPAQVLEKFLAILNREGITPLDRCPICRKNGWKIYTPDDGDFPDDLRNLTDMPLVLYCGDESFFVKDSGAAVKYASDDIVRISEEDIDECFQSICRYSVYTRQDEIKNGFVTMKGGHRAGICGTAVYENNSMTGVRNISSINVRISKEVRGISREFFRLAGSTLKGTLICGVPCSGKTTLLRDIARVISLEKGLKVSIIDERGELGGGLGGELCNDTGFCDVFSGYRKADGMMQAVRCMSPDVIICDEIGSEEEAYCVSEALNSGVTVIASVHCSDVKEFLKKPQTLRLANTSAFECAVFLSDRRHIGKICSTVKIKELMNCENNRLYTDNTEYDSGRLLYVAEGKEKNTAV